MEYDNLRHFADSWGLLFLFLVFATVIAFVFRPGSTAAYRQQALIPLKDNDEDPTDGPARN